MPITTRKRGTGKRERISPRGDTRFVRRDSGGRFRESDDAGRSLRADRKTKAKAAVKSGMAIAATARVLKGSYTMARTNHDLAQQITTGLASGALATIPMTMVMEGMKRLLPHEQLKKLPPEQVMDRAANDVGVKNGDTTGMTATGHFAFGALSGAVFSMLPKPKGVPPIANGMAFGLAVWAVNYLGWLPALNWHPSPRKSSSSRNAMLIASHLVWGAALGTAYDKISGGA